MAADLEPLNQRAQEVVRRAGRDSRQVFVRVRGTPDGAVVCESNDAALLPHIQAAVASQVPDSVQSSSLPRAELTGRSGWITASVAEVRRTPSHLAEQTTQALQGEILQPLLHEDGWLLAVLPDGYIGWVRDWHLQVVETALPARFRSQCDARIAAPWVQLRAQPRADAAVNGETIHGTSVRREARSGSWVEVELPGGRRGWLPDAALRPGCDPWPRRIDALLSTLLGYRGVPYLWGGKSPKGFDCSGLVQFGFGLHGIALPRDADQQALCGIEVERREPGDLMFFGRDRVTHVAVALDAQRFVHARGETRLDALAPGTPEYDPELHALYRGARRVWEPAG